MDNQGAPVLKLPAEALLSVRDHVHRALRAALLSGSYKTDELLNERQLAIQLGVSTTPVKEALRKLEAEGLVVTLPRRGVVSKFSPAWAEEMILARVALESMISRKAATRITSAASGELEGVVNLMSEATDAGDSTRLIELNETLHSAIHQISGCNYLSNLINRQKIYDDSFRRVIHSDPTERIRALEEHRAIAKAIIAGDADRAELTMREHVQRSGERYLAIAFPNQT